MSTKISIDGVILNPEEAKVPVLDRGFLYGDSVYEVLRTCGGRPFALTEHLNRLRKSAQGIFLQIPWSDELLAQELDALLAAAGNEESYIRLIVTRGEGAEIGLDPSLASTPRRIWIVRPYPLIPRELYEKGARVALVRFPPGALAGVKTGNYLVNILALREARSQNAYEAFMVNEKEELSEGANSNIFLILDGVLCTPPPAAGILEGITRRKVIELAKEALIPLQERPLLVEEAYRAQEAFMTSTLREIMPVTEIDGKPVGDGKPGPLTRELQERFRAMAGGKAPGT